jgi:hypothetical protein
MRRSEYVINRGVNAPIVFKGLQGQYIGYLGGGLAALLILFVILYLTGVNTWICLIIVMGGGGYLFRWVFRTNKKYGVHGVMKQSARRLLPREIRNYSRRVFCKVKRDGKKHERYISGSGRGA